MAAEELVVINVWGAVAAIAVPTVAAAAAYLKGKSIERKTAKQTELERQNQLITDAMKEANRHIDDLRMMLRSLLIKEGIAERPKTARERVTDKL